MNFLFCSGCGWGMASAWRERLKFSTLSGGSEKKYWNAGDANKRGPFLTRGPGNKGGRRQALSRARTHTQREIVWKPKHRATIVLMFLSVNLQFVSCVEGRVCLSITRNPNIHLCVDLDPPSKFSGGWTPSKFFGGWRVFLEVGAFGHCQNPRSPIVGPTAKY